MLENAIDGLWEEVMDMSIDLEDAKMTEEQTKRFADLDRKFEDTEEY